MAQIGRAELLRALQMGAGEALALEHDDQAWWGYQRCAPEAEPPAEALTLPSVVMPISPAPAYAGAPTDDPLRMPLRMPVAWVLREQTERDLPKEIDSQPKLTEADLRALAPEPLPYRDLVPWARALPGIRSHTDRQVPGGIDWPRLGDTLARQQLPRRLPRRTWQRWPQRVLLVLDFSPRLDPYRWDFHRLALQLSAQLPTAQLGIRLLRHGPAGPWQAWPHPRKPRPWQAPQAWEPHLSPGTVVLCATDLGLFDAQPAAHQAWLAWADPLKAQGCRLIALAPLGTRQLSDALLQRFELVRWSPDSRWHRERCAPAAASPAPAPAQPANVDEAAALAPPATEAPAAPPADAARDAPLDALLALAATALRIDPPLLRAWRSLLPVGAGDASLEGRLWNHPHLQTAGLTCATRAEHLDAHLARHAALPGALRDAARAMHQAQHAHLRRSLGWAEALRWQASDGGLTAPASADPGLAAAQQDPLGFVKRLLHSLADETPPPGLASRRSLLGAAELVQAALSPGLRARDPALFAALDAAVARWRAARGGESAPAGQGAGEGRLWLLVQQGPALCLVPTGSPGPGQILGLPVLAPAAAQRVWLRGPQGSRWLALGDEGAELAVLGDTPTPLTVTLDRHTWVIDQAVRPAWADAWRMASGRLGSGVPIPGARAGDRAAVAWFEVPRDAPNESPGAQWLTGIGLDDHGAFAELQLVRAPASRSLASSGPRLRLRWIPPGRFLMGSPDGEGRDDEHPQHPVLISQGFWLAEGPCPQDLWQAVMGGNPSHFKEAPDTAQRPVEQVSFDDVQQFLQRLRDWLPAGCDPVLPTEAQWEYAARAGSTSAYPWGDAPDDAYANWGQQHQGTTAVGRFPPNLWGLFDMHGNVWEWCADSRRNYTVEPQRDPQGEGRGVPWQAVRGGSWFDLPGRARSACRSGWHPAIRRHDRGFRLALRFSSPGAGGPLAEPAQGPGGALVAEAGRPGDDPGFLQTLLSRLTQALTPPRKGGGANKKGRR